MLKKRIKLFGSLLVLASSSLIVTLAITSCGITDGIVESSPPDAYSEYINDRTFSIGINTDSKHSSAGTAWIFQQKSPLQEKYEYYLATNLHVSVPFNPTTFYDDTMFLAYNNDYKKNTSLAPDKSYFGLPKSDPSINAGWKLLGISGNTRPRWETRQNYEWDVDFNVFDVNFGNEATIKAKDPYHTADDSPLLNRLNKLNVEAAQATDGKTITPFTNNDYRVGGQNLHVGGFPSRPADTENGEPKWTYYSTKCAGTDFTCTPDNPNLTLENEDGTWNTMSDGKRIIILGKQIDFPVNGTQALTGGSSGSLVINDEYQAVAINFAGKFTKNRKNSTQNFALMLNCDDSYYDGNSQSSAYKYDVLSKWFSL